MSYQFVLLLGGSSWTVPGNWNNNNNRITCIGGGGGGSDFNFNTSYHAGGGGGGGARASSTNVSLTPGASISISVGGGGAGAAAHAGNGAAGGDTSFNSGAVLAKGGGGGTTSAGGAGGSAGSSVGNSYTYSGGNGGNPYTAMSYTSYQGGGGGAAGNTGNGGNGVNGGYGGTYGLGGTGGPTGGAGPNSPPNYGVIGYDNGSSGSGLGTNFSASGGGGAYTGGPWGSYGADVSYLGWAGGLFGGGGGGGGGLGGGNGIQGLIFIEWNPYGQTLSAGTATKISSDGANHSLGMILDRSGSLSLNDSGVRGMAGISSGQIAISDTLGTKYPTFSIIGTATNNGSGYSTGNTYQPFTSYPSGSQAGDVAVIVSSNYAPGNRTLNASGSGYIYNIANSGSYIGMWGYSKKLGPSDSSPMSVYIQASYTSHMLFVLRNISRIATGVNNAQITGTTTFYTPNPAYSDNGGPRAYLVLTSTLFYGYATVTSSGWTTIAQASNVSGWGYLNAQIIDAKNLAPGGAYTITPPNSGYTAYGVISSCYELT